MRRVMNYDFVIFYDGGEADDITVLETNKENCEATVRILMSDIRFLRKTNSDGDEGKLLICFVRVFECGSIPQSSA